MIHPFKSVRTKEKKEFTITINNIYQIIEHIYDELKYLTSHNTVKI
jgi:hypothetical protein